MKKTIILITIIALLALVGLVAYNGITIGNLSIAGIRQIKENNDELDKNIQEATKLASTDYQKSVNDLNDTLKKLESTKKNYQDMVSVSTDSQVTSSIQSEKYPIEYLWIKIGNYADAEGVKMKMQVESSSSNAQGRYNLAFTVVGKYVGIEELITNIEDDSSLGFKIEEFKMVATTKNSTTNTTNTVENTSEDNVEATFKCKDIAIEGVSSSLTVDSNTSTDRNTTNSNTTNNTADQNSTATDNTATNNTTKQ